MKHHCMNANLMRNDLGTCGIWLGDLDLEVNTISKGHQKYRWKTLNFETTKKSEISVHEIFSSKT